MSISGYSSSLSIPPYPGPTARVSDVKPVQRDNSRDVQQSSNTTIRLEFGHTEYWTTEYRRLISQIGTVISGPWWMGYFARGHQKRRPASSA